jgi:hypothetical protein
MRCGTQGQANHQYAHMQAVMSTSLSLKQMIIARIENNAAIIPQLEQKQYYTAI